MLHHLFRTLGVGMVLISAASAFAQETELKVVDEVVAQVNNDVITLSRVKREIKSIVEADKQQGKDPVVSQKVVEEKQGELIANLINEELMLQRAKEIGIDKEADAEVNQRFLQIMKENNVKTIEALYQEMEKSGVNPQEIREIWRRQAMRELLIQREIHARLYWEPTPAELKAYYEKNKAQFTKPETVTLSEIFLAFAGREENAVREKAKQLVSQLRSGADFQKLAVENSDKPDVATTKGKVDTFNLKELDARVAKAIENRKKGDVSDPFELNEMGVTILRVDDRSAASSESVFDERAVRMSIMRDRLPERQKEFMAKLRGDAYIKISDTYRPLVAPLLFSEERKDNTKGNNK